LKRCDWRATPRARAFPDESTERFIEVRLIRQTAFNRDLRKRQVRLQHQALCTLNSPAHHILVRRFIETFPKGPAEVRPTIACRYSPTIVGHVTTIERICWGLFDEDPYAVDAQASRTVATNINAAH
jgi:hypothetical protein